MADIELFDFLRAWIKVPKLERDPLTQKEVAERLGTTPVVVCRALKKVRAEAFARAEALRTRSNTHSFPSPGTVDCSAPYVGPGEEGVGPSPQAGGGSQLPESPKPPGSLNLPPNPPPRAPVSPRRVLLDSLYDQATHGFNTKAAELWLKTHESDRGMAGIGTDVMVDRVFALIAERVVHEREVQVAHAQIEAAKKGYVKDVGKEEKADKERRKGLMAG